MRRVLLCVLFVVSVQAFLVANAAHHPPLKTRLGVVAADNATASEVGVGILDAGGNAADAAVGVAAALGLTHPFASGLGGGGFCLLRPPGGEVTVLDFRETAPAAAHRDMFLDPDGNPQPTKSVLGGLAVGVPGEPAGLAALQRHGRLSLSENLAPVVALARDGYPASTLLEKRVSDALPAISANKHLSAWLLPLGRPPEAGERLQNPALAKTLETLSTQGVEAFYTGPFAQSIADAVKAEGGLLTVDDLAHYKPLTRAPLRGTYRGYDIITMPPPSSGGTTLLATLAVLEGFDLKAMGHNSSAAIHHTAEALKFAFADRAQFLADPDFTPVPVERLLSKERADARRALIQPHKTLSHEAYAPPSTPQLKDDDGTSHFSIIDAEGFMVACTTTVNTPFGSLVYVPSMGVLLNNQMDDFVQKPGVPNAFGLVGSEANAVEPRKRPLSSMTPTLILKDGEPFMVVGASGGPTIITATLQTILNVVDFGMTPRAAVEASRVHHQWTPNMLGLEPDLPADVVENLKTRGHEVRIAPAFSAAQVIVATPPFRAAACDPRKHGQPAAQTPR